MRLTLLVPELIWPEPNDQLTLGKLTAPAFEWLAAHALFSRQARQAYEDVLAARFGLTQAPFGALRRLGENTRMAGDDGHWLCADPVHLRFHHERIVLADADAFDLDLDEAEAIVAALNSQFADIGRFHVATSRRWYLQLHSPIAHHAQALSSIAGRRLDSELNDKNGFLTRWLNEVQMFLHGHPLNARREAAGKPAVNSLWLWGAGPLTEVASPDFSTVWSDNPLATGLALAADIEALPGAASLASLLADSEAESHQLVVLDHLLPPVLHEDSPAWRSGFEMLEKNWFIPLRNELGRRVDTLNILAPTIYGQLSWTLSGRDRWKFWRQPRTVQAIARELAEMQAETQAEGTPQ